MFEQQISTNPQTRRYGKSIPQYVCILTLGLGSCTNAGSIQIDESKAIHRWQPSLAQIKHRLQCKYHFSTSQLERKLLSYLNNLENQEDRRPTENLIEILRDFPHEGGGSDYTLTPAFPYSWPKLQEKVIYFAYPLEILGTGMPQTRIFAPIYAMIVDAKTGEFEMRSLPIPEPAQYVKDQDIITYDSFWHDSELKNQALELAENRLIAYTLGCMSLIEFQPSLVTHYEWKENESFLFEHIKPHIGTFLD